MILVIHMVQNYRANKIFLYEIHALGKKNILQILDTRIIRGKICNMTYCIYSI